MNKTEQLRILKIANQMIDLLELHVEKMLSNLRAARAKRASSEKS